MVFCTYCGQSFTRDEHLERHILTHTNVKPFKCFTCHMSFARRDLLQRHYTVHGRDQNNQEGLPPNPMIPRSAGRTPIACTNCAKTKTKCDKKFPCSRCASRNLKCTLRPTRRVSRNVNRIPLPVDGENSSSSTSSTEHVQRVTQTVTPEGSKGNSPQPQQLQSTPVQTMNDQIHQQHHSPEMLKGSIEQASSFFEQSPSAAPPQALPTVLSPLPTPGTVVGNGFISTTPMSGYEEFAATSRDGSDQSASPRFIMDWSQLQFSSGPSQFDTLARADLMMSGMAAGMGLTIDGLPRDALGEPGMLTMMPEFSQGIQAVQTPMTTPRMSTSLSDLEISAGRIYNPSSRHTSVSDSGVLDLPQVVKAQESWNCFRSAPTVPSASCPRTARLHLERLEQSLKNHEGWHSWRLAWEDTDTSSDYLNVVHLQESSKDKLLAITQTFLHKALEIHRESGNGTPNGGASPASISSNFILLPPIRVLEYFLRSYSNGFERFFPLTCRGTLDMNEQMMNPQTNDRASSLLTLLMLAAGSMSIPSMDARWLCGGLTEACRISLFDLIETNIGMASDRTVLHSALLFTTTAAWSGDKWHMDIAMGQRGMYTAMLRHSGALESSQTLKQAGQTTETLWRDWLEEEQKSRLIYSWAMVDQDLSFFRDSAPLFNVTEFGAPMPDSDRLWHAKSASEWSTIFNQVHEFSGNFSSVGSGARPLSLRELFRHFLDDEIATQAIELTPLHLRLLLHPLQNMVCQYRQLLSCFSDSMMPRQQSNSVTAASTRDRLEEVLVLLKRWSLLADRYTSAHPICPMMQSALTMFHLISLNAVTNFPEIERLARKESLDGSFEQLVWMHKRCISDVEVAVYHSGQVLRLIKSMVPDVRPPWWSAALYRAGLVLWTDSLVRAESVSSSSGLFPVPGPSFAVDALQPEHPLVARYLTKREGVPTLTKRDGTQIAIDNSFMVLSHCVDILDEGVANRFSDGIRSKLEKLARGG